MPVTFHGLSSNKAPLKLESPNKELFTTPLDFIDGTRIWRSVPQPDRIVMAAVLAQEHFGKTGKAPASEGMVKDLALGLAQKQLEHNQAPATGPKDGFPWKFSISIGERDTQLYVVLSVKKTADFPQGEWTIRFEFTPRKAQPGGMEEFIGVMIKAAPVGFNLGALLRDCRVRQVDVAVDYAGVTPAEVIATAKSSGKRCEWFGDDGALETIYLYGKKTLPKKPLKQKPKKPYGNLVARIYNRDRDRQSVGKPPPYSQCTVTRLEVVKTRFDKPLYLGALDKLPDQFGRVKLSLGRTALGTQDPYWPRYLACVRALGPQGAEAALSLTPAKAKSFKKTLRGHPSDLLPPGEPWKAWGAGLAATGLSMLIEKAQAADKTPG